MLVTIHLNRDSVHAGDDVESHELKVDADSESHIASFLRELKESYLPGIAGGEATWIVSCSGNGPSPLGVLAQQWQEARLRTPPDATLSQVLGHGRLSITFEYWCQKNPMIVFDRISAGKEPPPRW